MDIMEGFESSFLEKLMYNVETKELIITIKGNREYVHENVPEGIWNEFKKAESKGKFYTMNIKGKYIADAYKSKEEIEKDEKEDN